MTEETKEGMGVDLGEVPAIPVDVPGVSGVDGGVAGAVPPAEPAGVPPVEPVLPAGAPAASRPDVSVDEYKPPSTREVLSRINSDEEYAKMRREFEEGGEVDEVELQTARRVVEERVLREIGEERESHMAGQRVMREQVELSSSADVATRGVLDGFFNRADVRALPAEQQGAIRNMYAGKMMADIQSGGAQSMSGRIVSALRSGDMAGAQKIISEMVEESARIVVPGFGEASGSPAPGGATGSVNPAAGVGFGGGEGGQGNVGGTYEQEYDSLFGMLDEGNRALFSATYPKLKAEASIEEKNAQLYSLRTYLQRVSADRK